MSNYTLGTADPKLTPDPGAGVWASKSKTAKTLAFKAMILEILPEAYFIVGDDATKHMQHYLNNIGTTYTIDLKGMLDDVKSAKKYQEAELAEAQAFVETLPAGVHQITSQNVTNGYNYKSENWNWFFAIGGYSLWGKGTARVSIVGPLANYTLDFELKFYDRYNWDGGKSVTLLGITITDETMGELHRQGLAKEFDCIGSLRQTVSWQAKRPVAATAPPPPPTIKTHIVKPGDSLSKIAHVHYGQTSQWAKIYAANKGLIGPNPNALKSGQKLVIP
jgi:LysM domain-containing protein